jgi:hypothetical protein
MLYFEGGDRAAIMNVFDQADPRSLFAAAKLWAATVGANGVPYHVTLAPIGIARGAPQPPDPAKLQLARDVLTECTRQRASLLDGLNRIGYVLEHESLYGFRPGHHICAGSVAPGHRFRGGTYASGQVRQHRYPNA